MAGEEIKTRVKWETSTLGGGFDSTTPTRTLALDTGTSLYNARVAYGAIVPGRERASGALWTLSEVIEQTLVFPDPGRLLIMLGATKAWYLQSGATLHEITPTPAFGAVTHRLWQVATMLHSGNAVAVVSNRSDLPHYWTGAGVFTALTNAPKCMTHVGYMGRMVAGGVYAAGNWYFNRLDWSDEGDITAWAGPTSGNLYLEGEGDAIQKLAVSKNSTLMIFRTASIYMGYMLPDPGNPLGQAKLHPMGCWAPNSVQELMDSYIFLSEHGVYAVSPNMATPVHVGLPIFRDLFRLTTPQYLQYAWSFVDPIEKEYYLITTLLDGTIAAWIFDYEEGKWSRSDFTGISAASKWYEI